MSLTPIAADPMPMPPTIPTFSLSATIELAKGIVSRGFTALLLCSFAVLLAQVPPQILVVAQAISAQADLAEARTTAVVQPAEVVTTGDSGSDGTKGPLRAAIRKALMSEGPDLRARTIALGLVSNCFNIVWAILVQLPLTVGIFLIAIRVARGESPGVQDILHGYRRLPAQWGVIILQYLATLPIYAVAAGLGLIALVLFRFPQMLAANAPAVKVGSILMGVVLLLLALPVLIIATWLAIRLTFCMFPVIDPAMGGRSPVAAVGTAWRISKGHVLELIVLFLLVCVITVATAACCVIPLFVIGLPAVFALFAAAWLLLMWRECPNAPELISRGPDGSWGLASQRVGGFDPSATVPADFRA